MRNLIFVLIFFILIGCSKELENQISIDSPEKKEEITIEKQISTEKSNSKEKKIAENKIITTYDLYIEETMKKFGEMYTEDIKKGTISQSDYDEILKQERKRIELENIELIKADLKLLEK